MASSGFEASEAVPPEASGDVDRERGEALVLELVGSQADSLLRVARRYSLCADDAHDAYQRGLEILMRHAARLDPERAAGWLHTVVKHEALAINRSRRRIVGFSEVDLDALESRTSASPEERVLASDRVARSAEALHGLKPQEVRALWLKALGHSYEQICEATGWTYTKVNRCLAEGRKSFLERYAGIESGQECLRLAPTLSAFVDGEADAAQTVDLRAHLRQCLACRAAVRGLHDASRPLAVVFPATGRWWPTAGSSTPAASSCASTRRCRCACTSARRTRSCAPRRSSTPSRRARWRPRRPRPRRWRAAASRCRAWSVRRPTDRPAAILRGDAGAGALPVVKKVSRSHARPKRHAPSRSKAQPRRRPSVKPRQTAPPAPTTTATATTTTATASRPRASAASAGGSRQAASAAAGEFGFEGP